MLHTSYTLPRHPSMHGTPPPPSPQLRYPPPFPSGIAPSRLTHCSVTLARNNSSTPCPRREVSPPHLLWHKHHRHTCNKDTHNRNLQTKIGSTLPRKNKAPHGTHCKVARDARPIQRGTGQNEAPLVTAESAIAPDALQSQRLVPTTSAGREAEREAK